MVSAFPSEIQTAVAAQLADCLVGVVAQRLRFRSDLNIRVPECEVLIPTNAVKAHIRNRDFFKIISALEIGAGWPAPLLGVWTPAYHHLGLEGKRRGCEVILTGGGGDEWLCVTPYYAADLLRVLDLRGLYELWYSMHHSFRASRLRIARNVGWRFGAQPLLRSSIRGVLRRLLPGWYAAARRWRSGDLTACSTPRATRSPHRIARRRTAIELARPLSLGQEVVSAMTVVSEWLRALPGAHPGASPSLVRVWTSQSPRLQRLPEDRPTGRWQTP